MRTTIDLPDDLHRLASGVARDEGITLSAAVAKIMRRALAPDGAAATVTLDRSSGLPVVRLGRPITSEDVRSLDDEL